MTRLIKLGICAVALAMPVLTTFAASVRETPTVRAIQKARASVANIHSEKITEDGGSLFSPDRSRKVNGMGTGVVIDERGYIVTNHHVVDGVNSLRVTIGDGSTYTAQVVSYDRKHDLAIIKVNPSRSLQVMPLGTSSDLMLGESVLAVGNAYGYEDTVTGGLISALSRDVEVNEKQAYRNLIQTDASINPGNSGGPLINLEGNIIGINVAIRAGAQRIGFAIPIDDARLVIAQLLNTEKLSHTYHGLIGTDVKKGSVRRFVVDSAISGSPAAKAGMKAGDIVKSAGNIQVVDGVDFERACLGRKPGESIDITIQRGGQVKNLTLTLVPVGQKRSSPSPATVVRANNNDDAGNDKVWKTFGLKLTQLKPNEKNLVGPRYRGGLRVLNVRNQSAAAVNGIQQGDILVGLHIWETISFENVSYVVEHPQLNDFSPLKFYVLRGEETLWGHLPVRR
jgi:serine protease Do